MRPIIKASRDKDGLIHWPDTFVGSDLDYGLDWSLWLANEDDTFVSMTWGDLPEGLSSSTGFTSDINNVSIIQIQADVVGAHKINGVMESIESGHTQRFAIEINLKVV